MPVSISTTSGAAGKAHHCRRPQNMSPSTRSPGPSQLAVVCMSSFSCTTMNSSLRLKRIWTARRPSKAGSPGAGTASPLAVQTGRSCRRCWKSMLAPVLRLSPWREGSTCAAGSAPPSALTHSGGPGRLSRRCPWPDTRLRPRRLPVSSTCVEGRRRIGTTSPWSACTLRPASGRSCRRCRRVARTLLQHPWQVGSMSAGTSPTW
mmetsp:Transcript_31211/g.89460  ORF Transcript_31211/g.89460 Transcript_31211/m.89460 type:complete len:205 (+) Transcript_31211:345-959(+)